jgi:DNA replication protein DnaC
MKTELDRAISTYLEYAGEGYIQRDNVLNAASKCLGIIRKNEKGICLFGPVGTGKTKMMQTLSEMCRYSTRYFRNLSVLKLNGEFLAEGKYALDVVCDGEDVDGKLFRYNFDDLGAENPVNHFGNKELLMAHIIDRLYLNFQERGVKYHFTTNLSGEEIVEKYGERFSDRLEEMVEFVLLNGESFRGKTTTNTL